MSLLREAVRDLLRPVVKQAAGVNVRYHATIDGNVYPLDGSTMVATLDASAAEAETSEGIHFTEQVKDFKIDVLDLPIMPQHGDEIEVISGLGVATQWYKVLSTGAARAVEPLANFEDSWRIHTKNIPAPESTLPAHGTAGGDAFGNATGDIYGGASS